MEAVLPLKIAGDYQEWDLDRARMLVYSLGHWWRGGEPLKLHIVTQRESVAKVRDSLRADGVQIDLFAEGDLLPYLDDYPQRSGFKQQLIKIGAHRIVTEPYFLTLDADIICCKPFDETSFLIDGKGIIDWEPRVHLWWPNSADWLRTVPNLDAPGMSVTPEYLSKEICAGLEGHLLALNGEEGWFRMLGADKIWSEYSLYNLYAEKQKILSDFHHDAEWSALRAMGLRAQYNVWDRQYESEDITRNFEKNARGTFMVFQSNTHIPPQNIWGRVGKFFNGSPFPEKP